MFRALAAGFIAAALLLAGLTGSAAEDKKDPPKKREKIAVADPAEAAKDPDFAIQGEYVGTGLSGTDAKTGIQVVANGEGKFTLKALNGGLPGDGWDGKKTETITANRKDGKVAFAVKPGGPDVGTIADGEITVTGDGKTFTFKKVERKSKTLGEPAPQGAVALWAKPGDESNWNNGRLLKVSDGTFLTVAKIKKKDDKGVEKEQGGSVTSKEKFGAFKLHVEFRLAWMPNSSGQGRSNSGVYLQDRYEVQVLDSFGLKGENNECGGIYTQHKPLVNMCLPPLAWQTYDIEFTPAQFDGDGKKTKNARATIYHNGVKIHDDVEFPKECPGGQKEAATPGPFQFQDHGDPVVYRNVWVVPVK